ncbi:MAG TPA: alpha/beta hydrolase [Abditibacteriaceae bacterium]|jgi:predicted esterase|nr:alpha/beta hydrolase [Abditibacteriaceae bacterium]
MSTQNLSFIHRWQPAENSDSAPTLLLLHGTGGNENDLLELGADLWPQANRLSPRGRILENGMSRFFRRLSEGVFDEDDLKLQTDALADFVHDAAIHYGFDAARVVALGFSNGANIAASLMLLNPQVLSGAVLLRAMVPLETPEKVDLSGVKVFLASGESDPLVPVANANRLAAVLRERGAAVTHFWQHAGHNLTSGDIEAAHQWIAEHFARVANEPES